MRDDYKHSCKGDDAAVKNILKIMKTFLGANEFAFTHCFLHCE